MRRPLTVAVLAAAALGAASTSAAIAATGRFHGTSSRGHAIAFSSDGYTVRSLAVRMETFCSLTGEESRTVRVSAAHLKRGRFTAHTRFGDGMSFTVRGTVGRHRAKGTIASSGSFAGDNACRGAITWTARR